MINPKGGSQRCDIIGYRCQRRTELIASTSSRNGIFSATVTMTTPIDLIRSSSSLIIEPAIAMTHLNAMKSHDPIQVCLCFSLLALFATHGSFILRYSACSVEQFPTDRNMSARYTPIDSPPPRVVNYAHYSLSFPRIVANYVGKKWYGLILSRVI